MSIQAVIKKIAAKENEEARFIYGRYYSKLQTKYPECKIVKDEKKSKIQQIRDQGYEDKLIELLKEDYEDLFNQANIKYTNIQKIQIFEKELHLIGGSDEQNDVNDDIKEFVVKSLTKVPDYFFNIPASSTGKYHPEFTIQVNGLAKHVKAAVKIAIDLFEVKVFDFDQRTRGIIIASLILHDCAKNGFNKSQYTVADHPIQITKFLKENVELKALTQEDFTLIEKNINSHMGKWNTTFKSDKEILPKPSNKMEYFVHICDYIASRKYINFDFNEDFNFDEE